MKMVYFWKLPVSAGKLENVISVYWKNAEGPLAAALKNDLTRSITLGFKMVWNDITRPFINDTEFPDCRTFCVFWNVRSCGDTVVAWEYFVQSNAPSHIFVDPKLLNVQAQLLSLRMMAKIQIRLPASYGHSSSATVATICRMRLRQA